MVGDQRVRTAAQLIPVACDFAGALDAGVEAVLELRRDLLLDGSGEDQRLARFEARLKPAGDQQVLAAVVAAAIFVRVGHALVPVGILHERGALVAHLHVQVGEALVQAVGHAVRDLGPGGVGLRVLLREGVDVAERQERTQLQRHRRRTLQQLVFHEDLVAVLRQHNALAKEDFSHLVGDLRHRVRTEIHHILMAARLVHIAVAMDAEVELLAIHDQGFVHIRQQQETVPAETVQRDCQQAVVAAGVARDDGRVAIGAGLVRAQDLPLERIGQIDQLGLVELQKSHIIRFNLFFSTPGLPGRANTATAIRPRWHGAHPVPASRNPRIQLRRN